MTSWAMTPARSGAESVTTNTGFSNGEAQSAAMVGADELFGPLSRKSSEPAIG
jgi:hypothetical protein